MSGNNIEDAVVLRVEMASEIEPEKKWTPKTRAPTVYDEAIATGKFCRLDDIGQVTRGYTSGANEFFFMPKGSRPDIEEQFIKPLIKTPKEVTGLLITEDMLKNEVFECRLSGPDLLRCPGAHAYVMEGERKEIEVKKGANKGDKVIGYNNLSTTKTRERWYALPRLMRADVLLRQFYNDKFDFPLNPKGFSCDHTFYYIHIGTGLEQTTVADDDSRNTIMQVGGYLNSSLSWLFVEVLGRKNMGDGVLTCYGPEMKPFHVLPTDTLSGIEELFKTLTERPVESVFDELGLDSELPIFGQTPDPKPDRKALDDFIFDIIDFSEEQRKRVYLGLCGMVQDRLSKAKNIL